MDIWISWFDQGLKEDSDAYVIIDVLRFSTTVNVALILGFEKIYAFSDLNKAIEFAKKNKLPLMAKEDDEKPKEAEFNNSPSEIIKYAKNYLEKGIKEVAIKTNSGSVLASKAIDKNKEVLIGSLLNAQTIANYLISKDYMIVNLICSGVKLRRFSIEDFLAAGAIVDSILEFHKDLSFKDEVLAALLLFRSYKNNLLEVLEKSETGKKLISSGFGEDLEIASRVNSTNVIPKVISKDEDAAVIAKIEI